MDVNCRSPRHFFFQRIWQHAILSWVQNRAPTNCVCSPERICKTGQEYLHLLYRKWGRWEFLLSVLSLLTTAVIFTLPVETLTPIPLPPPIFNLSFLLSWVQHLPYLFTWKNILFFLYTALPDRGDQALGSSVLYHNAYQSREEKFQESSNAVPTLLGSLDLGEVGPVDSSTVTKAEICFRNLGVTQIWDLLQKDSKSIFLALGWILCQIWSLFQEQSRTSILQTIWDTDLLRKKKLFPYYLIWRD